jgi:hypothetical protein
MKIAKVVLYCALGGLPLLAISMGTGGWGWCWFAGIVLAAAFVPVAIFGPRGVLKQFGVIAPVLLIVTVLTLWSEALIFVNAPEVQDHAKANLIGACVIYGLAGVALAVMAAVLKLNRKDGAEVELKPAGKFTALLVVCALAYVLYYLVFGWLTYRYFTASYYPDATQVVARLGGWFWLIQVGRGVLMTLAMVPVIRTLRMTRMQTAIVAGLILWVAGGLTPLLMPNPLMVPTQRFFHAVEILTQNFPLGVTAVLLLRPKSVRNGAEVRAAAVA